MQWTVTFAGTNSSATYGRVAADLDGNSFTVGALQDKAFVAKFDRTGSMVWFRQASMADGYSSFKSVAVDDLGNCLVAGTSSGSLTLGQKTITGAGLMVCKFSNSGALVWAAHALSNTNRFSDTGLGVDSQGNCYVAGYFSGSLSFGVTNLVTAGYAGLFLGKYDAGGNAQWAIEDGADSSADTLPESLAVDRLGNCYVVGDSWGGGRFGHNIFLVKYSSSGASLWTQLGQALNGGFHYGHGVAVDAQGNSYATGTFSSTGSIGGSNGLTSPFLAKYQSNGAPAWIDSAVSDAGAALVVDLSGALYSAASAPGEGSAAPRIAKYDTSGNELWGIDGIGRTLGMAADPEDAIYISGAIYSSYTGAFISRIATSSSFGPSIVDQPKPLSVVGGTSVSFNVRPRGSLPLIYQWVKDGIAVDGANSYVLPLTNVQAATQGRYSVVITNDFGAVTSQVVRLVVSYHLLALPNNTTWGKVTLTPNQTNFVPGTTVTLTAIPAGGAIFAGWSGSVTDTNNPLTLVMDTNQVVIANFLSYKLVVETVGSGGHVTINPNQSQYAPGTTVSLTATRNPGYDFAFWSGDATGRVNPLTVVMDRDRWIQSVFASTTLSLTAQGQGSFTVTPQQSYYDYGEEIIIAPVPARWYGFQDWTDGVLANPRVVTIGFTNSYTAVFSSTTAVETLTFSNVSRIAPVGTPAVFVDGQFAPTGSVSRLGSTEISMRTSFNHGTIFFSIDGTIPSFASRLYDGPFTLHRSTVLRAISYDASFGSSWEADPVQVDIKPVYRLNTVTAGGGLIDRSPVLTAYASNTFVLLTARPATGWTFLQWFGDLEGTNIYAGVTVNRDLFVEALFGTALATTVNGNGSVLVQPQAALFPYGTSARLTGVPGNGSYFGAWGNAVSSANNPLVYAVTNPNPTISSIFGTLAPGQVSLTVLIDGLGRVATTPKGNWFTTNQTVLLRATPDSGQRFVHWEGDGSGTNLELFVGLPQNTVITARFSNAARLSAGACCGGPGENGFSATVEGELGASYDIEAATELGTWILLTSVTNTFGKAQFTDPVPSTNSSWRFYRVRSVQ